MCSREIPDNGLRDAVNTKADEKSSNDHRH
jgi:hypothetical protein